MEKKKNHRCAEASELQTFVEADEPVLIAITIRGMTGPIVPPRPPSGGHARYAPSYSTEFCVTSRTVPVSRIRYETAV